MGTWGRPEDMGDWEASTEKGQGKGNKGKGSKGGEMDFGDDMKGKGKGKGGEMDGEFGMDYDMDTAKGNKGKGKGKGEDMDYDMDFDTEKGKGKGKGGDMTDFGKGGDMYNDYPPMSEDKWDFGMGEEDMVDMAPGMFMEDDWSMNGGNWNKDGSWINWGIPEGDHDWDHEDLPATFPGNWDHEGGPTYTWEETFDFTDGYEEPNYPEETVMDFVDKEMPDDMKSAFGWDTKKPLVPGTSDWTEKEAMFNDFMEENLPGDLKSELDFANNTTRKIDPSNPNAWPEFLEKGKLTTKAVQMLMKRYGNEKWKNMSEEEKSKLIKKVISMLMNREDDKVNNPGQILDYETAA